LLTDDGLLITLPTIDRAAVGSLKQAGRPGPEGAHLPAVHTAIGLVAYCVR
jgi:hypothetical protein